MVPVKLGKSDPRREIQATIHLRRRPDHHPIPAYDDYVGCPKRERLSNADFAVRYGACQDDIDATVAHCLSQGLSIVHTHAARRHVRVKGTVAQFNKVFNVVLHDHKKDKHVYHMADRLPTLPPHLFDKIIHVGLGEHPLDRAATVDGFTPFPPNAPIGATSSFVPPMTYMTSAGWPTGGASGEAIAVLTFPVTNNAGNVVASYSLSDVQATCNNWGITAPTPINISVDGTPIDATDATGEWNMDICCAWGFGHGAQIAVYMGSASNIDTFSRIIFPNAGDPVCSVTTLSAAYTDEAQFYPLFPSAVAALHLVYEDAAIQGITICLPTQDFGSGGDIGDGKDHAPGSVDPYTLAVGGTVFGISPFAEWLANYGVVGNSIYQVGGGGGVSKYVPLPSYQNNSNVPVSTNGGAVGRGVPDVSSVFAGQFTIYVGGAQTPGGGTSQSCPMTAGLIASVNKALGRNVGFINPTLYSNPSVLVRDINPSNTVGGPQTNANGFDSSNNTNVEPPGYALTTGWDPCVGLGVINGNALVTYLSSHAEVPSLLDIALTSTTFTANAPVGTVIGRASVQTDAGQPFTGTYSLSAPAQPYLSISSIGVITTLFSFAPGQYVIGVIATQPGATFSPLTVSFTLTAVSAGNVRFTQAFNIVVTTITINPITGVQAGSTFTVSGTMTGFDAPPSLFYADDSGGGIFIPTADVTASSFSFTHPGIAAGPHTLTIAIGSSDQLTTISYSVANASAGNPVTGIGLFTAGYNYLQVALTPPDSQSYTYNVNVGTTGTGGPFPIAYTNLPLQFNPLFEPTQGFVTLPGLVRNTPYYVQIFPVAPGNLIGTAATGGPFTTRQPNFTFNNISASAGSPFEVTGTIT